MDSSARPDMPKYAPLGGWRLVIVGTGVRAAIACECFRHDSPYEVAAFCAEAPSLADDAHCGLPVVPFDDLTAAYPPGRYRTFVATSPADGSRFRRQLYDKVTSAGYNCVSYVSSRAFAARSARLGENTFVHEGAALQHGVKIGSNVVVGSGTCVGHSTVIEDDCFIGPHVAIAGFCRIGRGSFLGANSCLADTTQVAEGCVITPGAVILKDTEPGQVYTGNPARRAAPDSFRARA
jgi:sugar O-acyltransferase (sialic acid O-acetyltransferase NeuD family)